MQQQIAMVTGATAGIGKETARGLAQQGMTVIVVGRNAEKTARVAAEIRATTGNPNVEPMLADFASLAQVRALADAFKARYDRLDVLVNNAGIVTQTRQVSVDGYELMFAVNYLAPFLLTNLLLDVLKASAPARIVNVSSFGYKKGAINFDDLQWERTFEHRQAYYQTRLGMVLFTLALARRLDGTGVTANVLHPGIVKTALSHDYMANPVFRFFEQLIAVSPAQGAQTSIFLASSSAVANVSGQYFEKQRAEPLHEVAQDQAQQERLWDVSMILTDLHEMAGA